MSDITLTITEDEPVSLKIVEAALKPEQEKSVEPTYEPQTVLPDAGCVLSAVHVGAIPPIMLQNKQVTPTKQTQNVTADDGYAGLESVAVEPIPDEYIVPTGTKQINITKNGTTTYDVTEYAAAEIITNVNTDPEKGLVFGDYDADGYPTTARFVGTWTEIPSGYCMNLLTVDRLGSYGKLINKIMIPDTVIVIRQEAFRGSSSITSAVNIPAEIQTIEASAFNGCVNVQEFVFSGNVPNISINQFITCNNVLLYDFSHATNIPTLYSVASLGHKSGCVIRIPAALSDTTLGTGNGWESETNWKALTDIVWEVV